VCDLEGIGTASIFRLIHSATKSATDLVRMLPTFDLILERMIPTFEGGKVSVL
jgi:hypothetical protein